MLRNSQMKKYVEDDLSIYLPQPYSFETSLGIVL